MPLSFFPRDENDEVPRFVEEQIISFKRLAPHFDIEVLVPHHGNTKSYEERHGIKIVRFHYFWPHRWERLAGAGIMPALSRQRWLYLQIPFLFLSEFIALLRRVRKGHYDYIYAHWFTPQGVVSGLVSRLSGVPFAFTSHSSDVEVWKYIPWVGKRVVQLVAKWAQAITVVSHRSYEKLKSFFSEAQWAAIQSKVAIIPMGIYVANFDGSTQTDAHLKDRYQLSGKTILLFLGRLVEKKGVDYLLAGFARLVKIDPSLFLVIAGEGHLRKQLEHKARDLGIDKNTRFVGFISGQTKRDYLCMAKILVVPSIITANGDAEGLPVTILEGMASGKLCIATYESGADDIIVDGENGILIRAQSVDEIVSAVKRVLSLSESEAHKISMNAKQSAMRFDWSIVARQHIGHLFSVGKNPK